MPGFDIRLVLHYRPVTIPCSTKDAYTSEKTFLALNPWIARRQNLHKPLKISLKGQTLKILHKFCGREHE